MIDIGGTNVKLMVSGSDEMRKFPSGRELTAADFIAKTKEAIAGWTFDHITLGFPGLVKDGAIAREPLNLSGGWLNVDFAAAFGAPVRIINDAALQALAHYRDGRMLFIGFGTSVGATIVADDVIVPIEVGLIPFSRKENFVSRLSKDARKRDGHEHWQEAVLEAVVLLQDIFWPSDTVIGGGNAKHLDPLPEKCRRGGNHHALRGAERMWEGAEMVARPYGTTWRIARDSSFAEAAKAPAEK